MGYQQEGTHCKENTEAPGTRVSKYRQLQHGEQGRDERPEGGEGWNQPIRRCLVYYSKEFRFPL